jgi:polar amino acid transport system substrate-binding protein
VRIIQFAISFLLFAPTGLALAKEPNHPIQIGSYLTPGLITEDSEGLFNQLNNAIFNEMNKSVNLSLSSLKRVRKGVFEGKLDTYFPELWENLPGEKNQYVVSIPIFYKRVLLFTLKNSVLSDISDFKDELLGVVEGFSYGKEIISNPHLNLIFQKDDITNIHLLLNNRIGGVLGGHPGTTKAIIENNAMNSIHYDLNNPVAILESFYVCKNDPKGIKLCKEIDKAIQSLKLKGALELNSETGFSRFTPIEYNVPRR